MSRLDPELSMYLKSARASTRDALSAMRLAYFSAKKIVAGRPTDADRDVLYGTQEIISDLQSAKDILDWYIDGHAGEVEE